MNHKTYLDLALHVKRCFFFFLINESESIVASRDTWRYSCGILDLLFLPMFLHKQITLRELSTFLESVCNVFVMYGSPEGTLRGGKSKNKRICFAFRSSSFYIDVSYPVVFITLLKYIMVHFFWRRTNPEHFYEK